MKLVWNWSCSLNGIWLYPKKVSRKDSLWYPVVSSIRSLIQGNVYGCIRQALFKFVKSIHTLIYPFFFGTTMMFDTHLGYSRGFIKLIDNMLSTSSLTLAFLLGAILFDHCLTSFNLGLISKWWHATFGSIPGICSTLHANTWLFFWEGLQDPSIHLCSTHLKYM